MDEKFSPNLMFLNISDILKFPERKVSLIAGIFFFFLIYDNVVSCTGARTLSSLWKK